MLLLKKQRFWRKSTTLWLRLTRLTVSARFWLLEKKHPIADTYSISIVSDSTQVSETIAKVAKDFGKIDVFVANAGKVALQGHPWMEYDNQLTMDKGMAISKPILEQTLDEYRKQMSVNGMNSI
jgi:NAD(P)-dependent dehydrogenase (short-subunit alcohol dehydrogenase family)